MVAAWNLLAPLFGINEPTYGLSEHQHLDHYGNEFVATNEGLDPEVNTVTVDVDEDDQCAELSIHFEVFILDPWESWWVSVDSYEDACLLKTYLENQTPPIFVSFGSGVICDLLENQREKNAEKEKTLLTKISALSHLIREGFDSYSWSTNWQFLPTLGEPVAKQVLVAWFRQGRRDYHQVEFLQWLLDGRSRLLVDLVIAENSDFQPDLYNALREALKDTWDGGRYAIHNPRYRGYKSAHEKLETELGWLEESEL